MPAVLVADGQRRKSCQFARPVGVYSVPRAVVAEARGIGDQAGSFETIAEEDRLAAVPGMTEVPDLVAADDDRVIASRRGRLMQREAPGQGQPGDRVDEAAGLLRVALQFAPRSTPGERRLQRAATLRPANAAAVVVKQLGGVTAGTQRLDEASRLPVGTVVDAFVKG